MIIINRHDNKSLIIFDYMIHCFKQKNAQIIFCWYITVLMVLVYSSIYTVFSSSNDY